MGHRRGEAAVRTGTLPWTFRATVALLAALLLGAVVATLPTPAHAVTPVAAEPRDRQKLSDPPGAVTLAFTREVDPGVAKLVVTGPDGKNVTDGPLIVEGTNVTSRLRDDLPRGTYTVHFRVDGRGGEPEGGAYQFSYGSGSFSDLPDRSWSGEDEEPAVLRGTNPNGSEEPDPPSTALATPGIEVTSQGTTTDPEPPASDPPSTVKAPPGPTTEAGSAPDTETQAASASPQPDAGGSGTPWVVGGVLLLLAVAGAGFGVWRSRSQASGDHD
ncbi:copper resistance CopC family protein [Microlunatus flavus]|uniref:Copper-binding protein CopC (Methionine-rich) n=1 Tax=Microlunatus flavus TaxID=1036181 RepID=A0A1H9LCJ3_9ACTN|nr:copper resistance CopC family protein [Microlunatus flavus]SER08897.1 Copper-binding protein CopC (methionine-rich) [Microlunatus flavus]